MLRALLLALLRLFYPHLVRRGVALPDGALIIVANHPNGLLDPLVLTVALNRPVGFLSKSTLFAIPVMRSMLKAFDAVPVYRASESDTSQNERTFAVCRERLEHGATIALFPEGISHDATKLAPLKTGAARIALSAGPDVRIVPVGIAYEAKDVFRSRASVTVGEAIDTAPFRAMAASGDERAAARALTDATAQGIGALVLQSEDAELWRGFRAVAAWSGAVDDDAGVRDERARSLADTWTRVSASDPEAAQDVADRVRSFARVLERVGVSDPLALTRSVDVGGTLASVIALVFLTPIALVGSLLSWPVYRAVGPLARWLSRGHRDVVGTYKVLVGMVLFPLAWLIEAVLIGFARGVAAALAVLVLAPVTGFAALRWGEGVEARRELLRTGWLVATRGALVAAIEARRRELVARVEALRDGTI